MGTHRFTIEGKEYQVEVGPRTGNHVPVTVNGRAYIVDLAPGHAPVEAAATAPAIVPAPTPMPASARAAGSTAPAAQGVVRAPMSGLVLSIAVRKGQKVATGMAILVLEAMKMENEIFAPIDGVVAGVHVQAQQQVGQGDLLVTIAPG